MKVIKKRNIKNKKSKQKNSYKISKKWQIFYAINKNKQTKKKLINFLHKSMFFVDLLVPKV